MVLDRPGQAELELASLAVSRSVEVDQRLACAIFVNGKECVARDEHNGLEVRIRVADAGYLKPIKQALELGTVDRIIWRIGSYLRSSVDPIRHPVRQMFSPPLLQLILRICTPSALSSAIVQNSRKGLLS